MNFAVPKPVVLAYSANGIKRSKRDCSALPVDHDEVVSSAQEAKDTGASLFSFSVYDKTGKASLKPDCAIPLVNRVREVLEERVLMQLALHCEAGGHYDLAALELLFQTRLIDSCLIQLSHILPSDGDQADEDKARDLLDLCVECSIGVQFLLDKPGDIEWYYAFQQYGVIPEDCRALLFWLGGEGDLTQCDLHALRHYLAVMDKLNLTGRHVWSAAACGAEEMSALTAALALGGHVATGPAYNHLSGSGAPFNDPQDQVSPLCDVAKLLDRPIASRLEARTMMFGPR